MGQTATRIREIAADPEQVRAAVPPSDDEAILFREPYTGRICLKVAIEDEFDIDIDEDEAATCSSVSDWAALVERMKPPL